MMRASLIAVVLSSVGGAVCAQSANETVAGLESCFQSARHADSVCSNLPNDAVQRLDCLQKARTAQLECLRHVPPPTSDASAAAQKTAATAALGSATVLPEKPAAVSPDRPARAVDSPSKPTDTNWIVSETTSPVDYAPLTVRLAWTASADGKTASYKDNAIGFLQSLPEGGRLKISVLDGPGPSHEETFQLAGLDAVREKIAVACKWAPPANKMTSEKR